MAESESAGGEHRAVGAPRGPRARSRGGAAAEAV